MYHTKIDNFGSLIEQEFIIVAKIGKEKIIKSHSIYKRYL